jgi:predicted signal transduction protein with EAL and GGDEF domain
LVLSPLVDEAAATDVAERVREALRQPFQLEGMSLRVDASIGIALAPDHGITPESVLQKADVAMFAAKRAHAPWQVYSAEHDQNARDRLELMEDLRDALRRHEIVLHYQPILDLPSGGVTAAEAWRAGSIHHAASLRRPRFSDWSRTPVCLICSPCTCFISGS